MLVGLWTKGDVDEVSIQLDESLGVRYAAARRNGWWDHKLAPKNHQASFGQRFLFKSAHCKLFLWKRCSSDILFNTYSATCKNVPVLQKQMAFSYRRNFPNQKF
ncbi:uncharacterized protein [Elaeis guineensis]|uniref:uncharacterized protein isoform X4 n=1 Tax=Elaeis guineensis var. tenera TaxID=51953 RepID=UPI003C6D2938